MKMCNLGCIIVFDILLYPYLSYYLSRYRRLVVVIVWYLGLLLPVQPVPITTKVVSSSSSHSEVYSIQHYVIKVVSDL